MGRKKENEKRLTIIKISDWSSTDYARGICFVAGPSEVEGRNKVAAVNPLSNFKCKLKYWSRWPPPAPVTVNSGEPPLRCICILSGRDPITPPTPFNLPRRASRNFTSLVRPPFCLSSILSFRYRAKKKKEKKKGKKKILKLDTLDSIV